MLHEFFTSYVWLSGFKALPGKSQDKQKVFWLKSFKMRRVSISNSFPWVTAPFQPPRKTNKLTGWLAGWVEE